MIQYKCTINMNMNINFIYELPRNLGVYEDHDIGYLVDGFKKGLHWKYANTKYTGVRKSTNRVPFTTLYAS